MLIAYLGVPGPKLDQRYGSRSDEDDVLVHLRVKQKVLGSVIQIHVGAQRRKGSESNRFSKLHRRGVPRG